MKKIKLTNALTILFSSLLAAGTLSAQIKLNASNYFHVGYQQYTPVAFGSAPLNGTDNGQWFLELWDGGIQFAKPWPSPNSGNYHFFIQNSNGFVGIGRKPSYKLDVNGSARFGTVVISSDARLKSNITELSDCMNKLNKLNGKSYNKKQPDNDYTPVGVIDSIKQKTILEDKKRKTQEIPDKVEFGFIAQELALVFPELTSTDSAGYLSVNYIGLIPVIIEALKSQKNVVASQEESIINLQKQIADIKKNCCISQAKSGVLEGTSGNTNLTVTDIALFQNIPNPFTQNTEIKYYLPATVASASLLIFNMQGTQLKTINIPNRLNGSIIINGSEFIAGMYLYTLIADGQEIDTKRMILTQ